MDHDSNSNSNGNSNRNNHDLGLYFLEKSQQGSGRRPTDMDEDEEAPTVLNTIHNSSGGFLVVSTEKLSLKYPCFHLHGRDVCVVQVNKPAPVKRHVYYFEIFVVDAGTKGQIAIGFTNDSFTMPRRARQPGWEANICGYHGDDGMFYLGQGKGEAFGPTFTSGDVVGGGVNYASQELFFTKNGAVVGRVCKDLNGRLSPTVSVHSQNEEVHINLGQKPFAFDLEEFEAQERMKLQTTIEQISLPTSVSHEIVRSYLLHYGYEDTLNSFDTATKNTLPPVYISQENGFDDQKIMYALSQRKTLRLLIRNGDIDAALLKLREWYPQIVQDDKSATCFLLHSQKFIELVRVGALENALKYGRIELAKFFELPVLEDLVKDCVALLAYQQPQESSIGYLLEDSRRELVADAVNAMILSTNPNLNDSQGCLHSNLERLLRQLTACCLERRSLDGDQGEAFNLQTVLNAGKKEKS